LWWKEENFRRVVIVEAEKKQCRERGSCRDHHAGHEDVLVVEGGAGGARGVHGGGGILSFLLDQDLLVPATGAAKCFLASARKSVQKKFSVSLSGDAEKGLFFVPNHARINRKPICLNYHHYFILVTNYACYST
jgi:hypothetical protein